MLKILSGMLVNAKSRILPAMWVGCSISWVKFKSKMTSQKLLVKVEDASRDSQLISAKLKSPSKTKLLKRIVRGSYEIKIFLNIFFR